MPKRVLYVEDDEDTREATKLFLEAHAWEVMTADDGQKALALYHTFGPFDAILLDVKIPRMNGFVVGFNIRNVEKYGDDVPRARHIYVAGREFVPPEELKESELADAYFLKPVDLNELLKALNGE